MIAMVYLGFGKKDVKIEQLQAQIEITEDPYAIRLMELDLEEERLNMEKYQVTINQTDNELNLMEWINKNYESFEDEEKHQNIMKRKNVNIGLLVWVSKQRYGYILHRQSRYW